MRADERRPARVSAAGRLARPNALMLARMVSTTPEIRAPNRADSAARPAIPHPGPGGVPFIPAILAAGPRSLPPAAEKAGACAPSPPGRRPVPTRRAS